MRTTERATGPTIMRVTTLALVVVLLTGCAVNPEPREAAEPGLGPAELVAARLGGEYTAEATEPGESPIRLSAQVQRVATAGVVVHLQQSAAGDGARRFELLLGPTRVTSRLEGRFSPLDARGERLGECPIEVRIRPDGFVARTAAATCRFGEAGRQVALVKEIAHNGRELVIADRVVDAEDGTPTGPDQVLRFRPVAAFTGWAGVREPSGAWRIARGLQIATDGQPVEPRDAGEMTLGVVLELAPHEPGNAAAGVLRLRVFDSANGALLGQSWADPDALALGIAVGDVQVGLTRSRAIRR